MLPVPPSIMVVPAPRAIVVLWELWPSTNGAHRVVTNPIPNTDATDRSPEPLKNIPLAMSSSYSLAVASAVENSLRRAVSMDPCATRGTRCDSTQMEGARPGTDHGAAPSDGTALQHVRRSSVLKGRARISPTAVRRSKLGLMGGLGIFVCQDQLAHTLLHVDRQRGQTELTIRREPPRADRSSLRSTPLNE